jgi:hypothetical protein
MTGLVPDGVRDEIATILNIAVEFSKSRDRELSSADPRPLFGASS